MPPPRLSLDETGPVFLEELPLYFHNFAIISSWRGVWIHTTQWCFVLSSGEFCHLVLSLKRHKKCQVNRQTDRWTKMDKVWLRWDTLSCIYQFWTTKQQRSTGSHFVLWNCTANKFLFIATNLRIVFKVWRYITIKHNKWLAFGIFFKLIKIKTFHQ